MRIEVIGFSVESGTGVVQILAYNRNETYMDYIRRYRDDEYEKELSFVFRTRECPGHCKYLVKWLHGQRSTVGAKTYGEALHAIIGTTTNINGRFLDRSGWA